MSDRWPGGIISPTENVPKTTFPYCSGIWTMEQAAYWIAQGQWPNGPSDPNFEYVTLLLNGDGTNGAQNNTFLDSSTNNFTITRNGNTTQGSFSPYGNLWSVYSDGSGDYLSISDSASFPSGTTEFCYELWFFPTATTNGVLLAKGGDGGYYEQIGIQYNSSDLKCYIANSSNVYIVNAGNFGTPTVGQWNHIAVYRSGNNFYGSLNGTVTSLATSSNSVVDNAAAFVVSGYSSPNPVANPVTGYISNLRLVTGSAVYGASNFTPPTTPLTAITGTQLLMCQANRFIDSSSNAFSITVGGNPSVQRFSPFEPTAPYSTSVIGGSGYFDGSGDFLNIANNAAFDLTGDFTVDGWMYSNNVGTYSPLIACTDLSNNTGWSVWQRSNAKIEFNYNGYNGQLQSSTIRTGNWNHFAVCNSGSTLEIFLNGVRTVSTSISSINSCSSPLIIGGITTTTGWTADYFFNGYLANLRVVKGSVLYSGTTYTVPTAPTTAVSGTGALTNFTNAGIPDLAMQNNLETAGNAQISTSVKKFGTGSLSFDGTGDYLRTPATNYITPLAGNFTIECWIYFNSVATQQTILGTWESPTFWELAYINGTGLRFYPNSSSNISIGGVLSTGTWYHVAVVRSGSTITTYLDGTSQSSATFTSSIGSTSKAVGIGSEAPWTGFYFNGYLDDIRITNGVARYTANFTPPTAALSTY